MAAATGDPGAGGAGGTADPSVPATLPAVSSIHIPSQEQEWLESLAGASGNIDGVPDVFLAIIDQAESSGDGGGVNSEGYGGWFGLGEAQAGLSTLESTSEQAFDAQAALVAEDYGAQLTRYGGNPVEAEEAYQEGSYSPTAKLSEGASLFESYGIGAANSDVINTAGSSKPSDSSGGGPLDILGLISTAETDAGAAWESITAGISGKGGETDQTLSGLSTAERDALGMFSLWNGFIQTMLLTAFFAIAALIVLYVLVKGPMGLPGPVSLAKFAHRVI